MPSSFCDNLPCYPANQNCSCQEPANWTTTCHPTPLLTNPIWMVSKNLVAEYSFLVQCFPQKAGAHHRHIAIKELFMFPKMLFRFAETTALRLDIAVVASRLQKHLWLAAVVTVPTALRHASLQQGTCLPVPGGRRICGHPARGLCGCAGHTKSSANPAPGKGRR